MASAETTQGQEVIECGLCHNPVAFFCRRCGLNLCDPCVTVHLRVRTRTGHDVVDYVNKDDDDTCFCDLHPKQEYSAFCKTCDIPICIICISIRHRLHEMSELSDKIEEVVKCIVQENDRIQSYRHELEKILKHTTKQLSFLPSFYQKRKDEVTAQAEERQKLIDDHVKKLHRELDDLKEENAAVLQTQKNKFERMIDKMDEVNTKSTLSQTSKNLTDLQFFFSVIKEEKLMKEFTQYTFPAFLRCKPDENFLQTYVGCIEKKQETKIALLEKKSIPDTVLGRTFLELLLVSSIIDTKFPADEENNNRLYDMAVTDDKKIWTGGANTELKLLDLQGNLIRTVTVSCFGVYICVYNKQLVFVDQDDQAVKKVSEDGTVLTMFTTRDWIPFGITDSESGDLLVCLLKDDQSKVVRYSSTGTVLQEIQYDSQCQSLYQDAWYIAENINGDIIVTDYKKKVIAVDRIGIFRYSYSGKDSLFDPAGVATDSGGHVFITDFYGDKIHVLDMDGGFLRYIIPEGGIMRPRALCMISDGELIVGECQTGFAKRIKFLEEKK